MRWTGPAFAAMCLLLVGCAGFSHQVPPGSSPLPEAWSPDTVLREQVPRGDASEVVLSERDGLSPDEAAIMAIDQNPRLRAIRAERGIGQAELIAAGVLPNPRLDASLDAPVFGTDANVLDYDVGLSWNVTPLLSRGARVSAAEEHLASVDLDIAWQEWQVAQAARLHTIRAIYLERRSQVAGEIEEQWAQSAGALRRARATAAVTELEVTNAEYSYAEARIRRLDLQRQLVTERAALDQTLGIDTAHEITLDLSFTPPSTTPNLEGLLDDLPRRRLDLLALQHAHLFHDEALRAEVIAQFPPVEIGLETRRDVDQNGSVGVTLSFGIPFFDRNQGAVAEERARRVEVDAEYDARLFEARTDLVRFMGELGIAREQLVAATKAVEAAGRLAEQARTAAAGGTLSPLAAADILERYRTTRLRVLEIEQTLAELQVAITMESGAHRR